MGGQGSGRKPDIIKKIIDQNIKPINPDVITGISIPNYSGLQSGLKKTDAQISVTPAGNNTEIQFNDSGVLGADSNFAYDKTNLKVQIGDLAPIGKLDISGSITNNTTNTSAISCRTTVTAVGVACHGFNIAPTIVCNTTNSQILRGAGKFDPQAAIDTLFGINNNTSIGGSTSNNITNVYANYARVSKADTYSGTIAAAHCFYAANATGSPTITDQYGLRIQALTAGTNNCPIQIGEATGTKNANLILGQTTIPTGTWSIYNASSKNSLLGLDSKKVLFGTGSDASIYYDATDLVINPKEVGSGVVNITGGLQCDSITNDTGLAAGVYTPSLTNGTNVAASTAYECQYMRVGNTVTVSGKIDIDQTAAGVYEIGISLPIASNFGAEEDCAGTAAGANFGGTGQPIYIKADATNNRASMNGSDTDITNHSHFFHFTYQVI